jgi:hypothetical protein
LDGKTFAIGVLAVTATVLFVGLMLLMTRPAQAIGLSDKAGDYKMLTQQVSRSKEVVVVLDSAAKRAILYDFDYSNKRLEIAEYIPLDEAPTPPPEAEVQQPQRRRRP